MVMWNGSGEALSGYSITNGVLGVALRMILFSSGRGVLLFSHVVLFGTLTALVSLTVRQGGMSTLLTELPFYLYFMVEEYCDWK